uniref:Uncharacterized protein LOC105638513 isoform X1 n=1 Tax=Rhizophora mucronata TaxID=61149 RepID=A0A2P2MG17_RHIMU
MSWASSPSRIGCHLLNIPWKGRISSIPRSASTAYSNWTLVLH